MQMILDQLQESTAVLSASQIVYRLSAIPSDSKMGAGDESMDLDGPKRRLSAGDPRRGLEEMAEDLGGALPDNGSRLFDKLRMRLEGVLSE